MKKMFKMLSLICVLALSVTAFSVLALAAGPAYDRGNIQEAAKLAEEFLELETDEERIAKVKELSDYLFVNVIGVKHSKAVFAEIYGGVDCDACRGKEERCADCEGKMGPYAEYRYNKLYDLFDKIMAYGAVYLIDNYDAEAHNYEQRATVQWLERFLEYEIADYTKADVLADDFFAEFDFETCAVKSVEIDEVNRKATYVITISNPTKDEISFAVSETLDADMISEIDSVVVGDVALTDEDYTYDDTNGAFAIADGKVKVPGVGYNAEAVPTEGVTVVTVTASIDEGYVFPTEPASTVGDTGEGEPADTPNSGDGASGEPSDTPGAGDETVTEPTIAEYYEQIKASYEAVLQAAKDKLSNDSLDEFVYSELLFNPDYTINHSKYIANYKNAVWYGAMYENGYRPGDVMPKHMYGFDGEKFISVTTGMGDYDRLDEGSYVIFDDSVSTFYQGTDKRFVEVPVKRNYVYNEVDGGFVQVDDGDGIYDFIEFEGYGKLLDPDPFLHIDMTGKYMGGSNPYTNWASSTPGILNMVMQTDVTYFTSKGDIKFQPYYNYPSGYTGTSFLDMRNRDLVLARNGKTPDGVSYGAGNYKLVDAIVPGKWTNIAMVLRGADSEIDIYVDYELVFTSPTTRTDITSYYSVRASVEGDTTGDTIGSALKNTVIYQGTALRDFHKFDKMSDEEKFAYYADYISQEGQSPSSQIYAYEQMTQSLPLYFVAEEGFEGSHIDAEGNVIGGEFKTEDAMLIAAVKQYYSFDYSALVASYKLENAKAYKALVDKLTAIERRYNTIDARARAVADVDKFVALYSDEDGNITYIDTECEYYVGAKADYDKASELLANDEISFEFVFEMEKCNTTGLYKKKQMYYENATAILKASVFDETITEAGETRLTAAYAVYEKVPEELGAMVIKQNSKYLVMYIDYTQDFDTVESWEQNYDLLSYPLSKARDIIKTGKYDPAYTEGEPGTDSYKSLESLLVWYELINSYFYDRLQTEHIEYIKALQKRYAESDSYMEKLGICGEIKRYTESAELDLNNPEIKLLIEKNEEYLAEIGELEAPYIAQRDKRTELFVSVIKKLDVTEDYNEMKALADEATSYYYTMTVGPTAVITDEQITEAINKYNYYIEYVEKVAVTSADFVLVVNQLDGADTFTKRYAVLAEAAALIEYVSEDIEGVSEAYAEYEAAYEDYMAVIAPANVELKQTQGAVISLRTGYCVSAVLAEFAKLIGSIVD